MVDCPWCKAQAIVDAGDVRDMVRGHYNGALQRLDMGLAQARTGVNPFTESNYRVARSFDEHFGGKHG